MEIALESDKGLKRAINEDAAGYFHNRAKATLIIVCDGVGGHNGGDVASAMAVTHLGDLWQQSQLSQVEEVYQWLVHQIRQENDRIYRKAQRYDDLKGMGTTLVCAAIVGDTAIVANVGDSRAYLFRSFQLKQVTQDHTLVNELLKAGEITPEEALHHPQKNLVTESLGVTSSVAIDFVRMTLKEDDLLLLCSDGLTNMVSDEGLVKILSHYAKVEDQTHAAIEMANAAGGRDNITVAIAKYKAGREEA